MSATTTAPSPADLAKKAAEKKAARATAIADAKRRLDPHSQESRDRKLWNRMIPQTQNLEGRRRMARSLSANQRQYAADLALMATVKGTAD